MKRRGRGSGGKKKRGEQSLQRQSRHRSEKTRILIVCEGKETEPNYFRGLRDEEAVRQKFSLEIRKGKGGSCVAVVEQAFAEMEKAANRGENFDEVWCVFDAEQAGQRDQVIQGRALARQHDIQLAISNPAFEVWLLAHFVRTRRAFADSEKVIEALNKHWRAEFGQAYEKNDEQLYTRLKDQTRTAIDNARRVREQDWSSASDIVDCNSASDVYLLVEHLLGSAK
jgi:hypothetical protein